MKKIVTIVAAALIASAAFAQVGIGAWGRGVWAPVAGDSKNTKTYSLPSWAWDSAYQGPRVGISINASSENVGFNIDMNGDNGGIGAGDTQYIWVKPWSFLTVQVGKVQDISARGDACFGAFNWLRNSSMAGLGEDFTFTRFGDGAGAQAKGAIVKVTPVEGLWIEAAFDLASSNNAKEVYGNYSQYGAGYVIKDIGHIRAQFITDENKTNKKGDYVSGSKINAAFDLTAVENLFVTVGAFIPMSDATDLTTDINAYASYAVSMVKIHALFGMSLYNADNKTAKGNAKGPAIVAGVGVDVDCGNGLSLCGDFRFKAPETDVDKSEAMSFLVGVQKGFSNGYIGLGFQGTTDLAKKSFYFDAGAKAGEAFAWQVPVTVSYWF